MELAVLFGIAGIGLILFFTQSARRRQRHRRYRREPFSASWHAILEEAMPLYRVLPDTLREQLQALTKIFIAEKTFVGCHGLAITEQIRVLIAAQACLLILNRQTDVYPELTEILVYPDAFIIEREVHDPGNVVHSVRATVSGESWSDSRVILSWEDVRASAAYPGDGYNVVIHEFAHQLDHESGATNGAPWLADPEQASDWAAVLSAEFEQLRARQDDAQGTLIDPYASQNPAEFFAVISEVFFEQPQRLKHEHPSLYSELSRYYRLDPAGWIEPVVESAAKEAS